MDTFKTSETWSLLISAILGVLVHQQVLPVEVAAWITNITGGLVAVIIARFAHKIANGGVPFRPLPKP